MTPAEPVCRQCGFDWRTDAAALADRLETAGADFALAVAAVPPDQLRRRPAPAVWSALEYLGHGRDVLRWYRGRIDRVLDEDHPLLEALDWDTVTDGARYHERSQRDLLADFEQAARSLSRLLSSLTEAQWQRCGIGSEGGPRNVLVLAQRAVHEVEHHLVDLATAGAR
ncbi:MAG: hypothetical protein QOG64_2008 [Acidimicrobiaceae bacterium]|nr:hypothetical protein [Acidimicrobiaceae bacterium]